MLNNIAVAGMMLALASLLFILLGIRIYTSVETKKENYISTTGTIITRTMSKSVGRDVIVEFEANGKKVKTNLTFPVGYDFPYKKGDSIGILYCPSKAFFIQTYSVVPDDGVSQQRIIRFRCIIGIIFIAVGLILLIPAVLLLKKK